jgi:hypothetical protein
MTQKKPYLARIQTFFIENWLALILITLLTIFYFWELRLIPFHPDESTQLFMSNDFDYLVTDPLTMVWDPYKEADGRQLYRELDAPETKYILGLGRTIAGLSALPTDWDWSKPKEANDDAGALPSQELLLAGRASINLLLPFSVLLVYLIAKRIAGQTAGLIALLVFGTHALVLIHARRAMAEGALLFGVTLATWSILLTPRKPWLTALCMAIAFNAKQSALALFPVGLIAVLWPLPDENRDRRNIAFDLFQYLGIFVLVFFALNPLYWSDPLGALQASLERRQALTEAQTDTCVQLTSACNINTFPEKIRTLIYQVYFAPGVYPDRLDITPQIDDPQPYLSIPFHNLFRGLIGGSIFLILSIFGFGLASFDLRRSSSKSGRELALLLLATLSQGGFLLVFISLPWSRYSIPMVPFVCIWIAYGLARIIQKAPPIS